MLYRGRFAPSPTGPLHLGSLVAALASFLDARAWGGEWLVRIEDLDPLRESRQAADKILTSLEAHGFEWDEPVRYQSEHLDLYHDRLVQLKRIGAAYDCPCSRKELQASAGRHPRRCREMPAQNQGQPSAVRFAISSSDWCWHDLLLGPQSVMTTAETDDFVLLRKEGFFAYQLAVVSDDIEQGITHVVRGSDLLDSTPLQLALYEKFTAPAPAFMHLPVITDDSGRKLSKQTFAPALDDNRANLNIAAALNALNHPLPERLLKASPGSQLAWSKANWQRGNLPARLSLRESNIAAEAGSLP